MTREVLLIKTAEFAWKTQTEGAGALSNVQLLNEIAPGCYERLKSSSRNISINDWFARYNALTAEVFIRDPSRNKLSVLLDRTNHAAYHLGQPKPLR